MRWSEHRLGSVLQEATLAEPWTIASACRRLGALGPWLLSPTALAQAAADGHLPTGLAERRVADGERGLVLALLVWNGGTTLRGLVARGVLAPAFVLPLVWRAGTADSSRLPAGLGAEAASVRGAATMGLHLHPALGEADLGGLSVEAASAWVSLAAGLGLARAGLGMRTRVLASGGFAPGEGPTGVGPSLDAKLTAAAAFGAEQLWVAPADLGHGRRIAPPGLRVHALTNVADPAQALAPLRAAMEAPPDAGAPLAERIAHHDRLDQHDRSAAEAYYRELLLPDLLAQCRDRCPPSVAALGGGTLFSCTTLRFPVALFALHALRPRRWILVHADEESGVREADRRLVMTEAARLCGDIQEVQSAGSPAATAERALGHRLMVGPLVLDATPGPKDLVLLLAEFVRRHGGHTIYLRSPAGGGRPVLGAQQFVLLQG